MPLCDLTKLNILLSAKNTANADKPDYEAVDTAIQFALRQFPEGEPQDVYDALGAAQKGIRWLQQNEKETSYNEKVQVTRDVREHVQAAVDAFKQHTGIGTDAYKSAKNTPAAAA